MRTLFLAWLCVPTVVVSQDRMTPGPYGPKDATTVVHIDVGAVRDSLLGTAIAESEISKAMMKFIGNADGGWKSIESVRLASVVRAERTRIRPIWVLHVRTSKTFEVSGLLETLGVDVSTDKASESGLVGYFVPAPGEIVLGETEDPRERIAGKKLAASPPSADRGAPYLLRARIDIPSVGVAAVGPWTLPVFDGVSYHRDPPTKISVVLGREPRTGLLQLRSDVYFREGGVSADGLQETVKEQLARWLRSPDRFHLWPALKALRVTIEGRDRHRVLALGLDFRDRRTFDAALGGYAPVAAIVEMLARQRKQMGELPVPVMQQEELVEEEEEEETVEKRKQEKRDSKKKKK